MEGKKRYAARKAAPSQLDFLSFLSKIPKLGPKRQAALEASGIKTVGDLLYYYPIKYDDRSKRVAAKDAAGFKDRVITVRGKVVRTRAEHWGRRKYRAAVSDGGGEVEAVWYFRAPPAQEGDELIMTGKVSVIRGRAVMFHPAFEKIADGGEPRAVAASYSIKEPMREAGISHKTLRGWIEWALNNVGNYPRVLPAAVENKYSFPPLQDCLRQIHLPDDLSALGIYKRRLKYEELYRLALNLRWNRKKFALPGHSMEPGYLDAKMRVILPFELTESQERAIQILYADSAKPARMHRLLQGDVGSGKTLTAIFAALPALNSGRQVAWMSPTEVLARQTKDAVEKYARRLRFRVGYLGAGGGPKKRETLSELASGELRFVVGTHALFMPSVKFRDLGMIIIDEQHKFGAEQRLKLQEKGPASDFLLMSATPIPQTLAKTLYGDLDIVEITSRPGRAAVATHIVPDEKRADMEKFILGQIEGGGRAFYVAPRIEAQEDDDNVKTVDEAADRLREGPLGAVPIHRLHGQMSYDEREAAISEFRDGPPGVLVATTIIEVGIDVADATVMVIENPEFFGLAQLHQIRGRVGRGDKASYCFLLPGEGQSEDTMGRLKFLCGCSDGFEIAEWDLRHRGPGEAAGIRQSGWDDLRAADILEDADLFREIMGETEGLFSR
nr:ATP-dependent DNA helicase recg [uncultured bacterium]